MIFVLSGLGFSGCIVKLEHRRLDLISVEKIMNVTTNIPYDLSYIKLRFIKKELKKESLAYMRV